jgi:PadR family transcriptional regulator PadR
VRRLGELEQIVLFALLRHGDGAYTVQLNEEIEKHTGETVSPGALYTTLERLAGRGLVSSWFGEPTPERGGKRKKHYRLEPAGAEVLARSWSVLSSLAEDQVTRLQELAGGSES